MDEVYVVFYNGPENEIAEIFEDYDEARIFIKWSKDGGENIYFSTPVPFHFNPKGTIWTHE